MRPYLILFALLFVSLASLGQQTQDSPSIALIKQAVEAMDKGDPDKAIKLLDSARKSSNIPDFRYDYETGFAYQLKKDYKNAIRFFEASTKYDNSTDQSYEMLGNMYDISGDSKKAVEVYKKGLTVFPNSGRLYLELGIMDLIAKNYDEAVNKWETGVRVDPEYPSNYFRLASFFSQTEERIWTIFYGEMFINLERNTDRTEEMSKLIYDAYQKSITITSDTSAKVDFTNSIITSIPVKEPVLPFRMAYGMDFLLAMTLSTKDKTVDLNYIASARMGLIEHWFKQNRPKVYPNILLEYQKELKDNGHLEAYTYWLLRMGDPAAFKKWYVLNESKFKTFAAWYNEHPLDVSLHHLFIRPQE